MISPNKIDKELRKIVSLIKPVVRFQLQHFRTFCPGEGEEKNKRDLVSKIDKESEQMIEKILKQRISDAGFFGEEGGWKGDRSFFWVVDPLDGTTNYINGVDQFAISIALFLKDNTTSEYVPIGGLIIKPITKDVFIGVKNLGAWHNQKKLEKVKPLSLEKSLVATGFPYRSPDIYDEWFLCAADVLKQSRGIRRLGCAALDLAYLASGYFQGFWESDLMPYDMGAAFVLLNETNVVVSDFSNKKYDPFSSRGFVAGFPECHKELVKITHKHYPENLLKK